VLVAEHQLVADHITEQIAPPAARGYKGAMSSRSTFYFEVMKLLLQVAWADLKIEAHEAETLYRLADQYRLDDDHRALLESYLSGDQSLPPPDFALLKKRKNDVLIALQAFMLADNALVREERELLAEIELLLA
jgi:hypothetical protein